MKKFFKFLMAAVAVSTLVISCSKDTPDGPVGPPDDKETPGVLTAKANTGEGVNITATDISDSDFAISIEMGVDCATYRFDVMPEVRFKNFYQEALKTNPNLSEEEFTISTLINDQGIAGYAMQAPFDDMWGQSKFKQAEIIHGATYLVLTVGCPDAEAKVAGEIVVLKVPLVKEDIVGNPKVDIKLQTGYYGYESEYTMNGDCYGYYTLETKTSDIDDAIGWVGDDRLGELVCCFAKEPLTDDAISGMSWPYGEVAGTTVTSIAVPLDINGTVAPYSRANDKLKPIPDDMPLGKYEISIDDTRVSALTAPFKWDVDYSVTRTVFFRWYTKSDWVSARDKYTDSQLQIDLATNGGFGINAASELEQLGNIWLAWGEMNPDTEYVLISTSTNPALKFTPIVETPFTTKPLIYDQTEQSLAQVKAKMLFAEKTSMRVEYTIPEGTTLYYDWVLEDGSRHPDTGKDLTDPANRSDLIHYMLFEEGSNVTQYTYTGDFSFTALTPDKKYRYYLIAEDYTGRLGPMVEMEFSTRDNTGGPDPKVEIEGSVVKDALGGYTWKLKYTINDDVTKMRYCVYEDTNAKPGVTPSAAQINKWTDAVIGESGMTTINSTTQSVLVSEYSTEVALAVVYGANDVQAPLAYLVFNPQSIMSAMLPAKAYTIKSHSVVPESISQYKKAGLGWPRK